MTTNPRAAADILQEGNAMELLKTRDKALELLRANRNEWEPRYSKYASDIEKNQENLKSKRKQFHEWDPLKIYLPLGKVMSQKSKVSFDVRFLGQSVANLIVDDGSGQILINTSEKQVVSNKDCFEYCDPLDMVLWDSKKAQEFRAFFKNSPQKINEGNEEHRLESLLLTEFSKKSAKEEKKALVGIQPVRFAGIDGIRIPMKTPLRASINLDYSAEDGGGIDILTRVRGSIGVVELKREKTPAIAVACQSVAYAVFIRELMRSESGQIWWNLLGFDGKLPNPLELYAVHAMPSDKNNDYSLAGRVIDFEDGSEKDSIVLHYLYFTEANNEITNIDSSLSK